MLLKPRPFFILLLFLFVSPVFSQSDFREGFVITNQSDTIKGLVDFQTNVKNTQLCRFKRDRESEVQVFLPSDIAGYRIDGNKFYISREVDISGEPGRLFLEYLLYGIANLYYVAVDHQKGFYYIEKDGTLHRLSSEPEVIKKDGKVYEKKTGKFKGPLKYLYQEAENLDGQIENADFNHKSMIKLARNYHNAVCDEFDCVVYEKSTKVPFYIEPRIGFLSARMGLRLSEDIVRDNSFVIGAHFSFNSLKIKDTWRFTCGLNYASLSFDEKAFFVDDDNPNNTKEWLIQSNYQFLEIPLVVKYAFLPGKFQPYVLAGGELVYVINPEYSYRLLAGTRRAESEQFRKFNIGLIGGAGIRSRLNEKLSIFTEANYSFRQPAENMGGVFDNHHVNSVALLIGLDIRMNRD